MLLFEEVKICGQACDCQYGIQQQLAIRLLTIMQTARKWKLRG